MTSFLKKERSESREKKKPCDTSNKGSPLFVRIRKNKRTECAHDHLWPRPAFGEEHKRNQARPHNNVSPSSRPHGIVCVFVLTVLWFMLQFETRVFRRSHVVMFVRISCWFQGVRERILHLYHPDVNTQHPLVSIAGRVADICVRRLKECRVSQPRELQRAILAIEMNVFAGGRCFAKLCRVNHSCAPNIVFMAMTNQWRFKALRDIKAGEELLHSYLGKELLLPSYVRRQHLWRSKCFMCDCERCTAACYPTRVIPCRFCLGRWRVSHRPGVWLRAGPSTKSAQRAFLGTNSRLRSTGRFFLGRVPTWVLVLEPSTRATPETKHNIPENEQGSQETNRIRKTRARPQQALRETSCTQPRMGVGGWRRWACWCGGGGGRRDGAHASGSEMGFLWGLLVYLWICNLLLFGELQASVILPLPKVRGCLDGSSLRRRGFPWLGPY